MNGMTNQKLHGGYMGQNQAFYQGPQGYYNPYYPHMYPMQSGYYPTYMPHHQGQCQNCMPYMHQAQNSYPGSNFPVTPANQGRPPMVGYHGSYPMDQNYLYQQYGPGNGYPGMMYSHQASMYGYHYHHNKQDSEVSPENNNGQDSHGNEEQAGEEKQSYSSSRQNKQHPIDESQSTQRANIMHGQMEENQMNLTGKTKQFIRQGSQNQNFRQLKHNTEQVYAGDQIIYRGGEEQHMDEQNGEFNASHFLAHTPFSAAQQSIAPAKNLNGYQSQQN